MNEFWDLNKGSETYSGYDITVFLTNQSMSMWTPEITFLDAATSTMSSQSMKLYDPRSHYVDYSVSNPQLAYNFNYEAVFDLELAQPGFDFSSYPHDSQTLLIRYAIMNFDAEQLQIYPYKLFCSQLADGTCAFS